MTNNQSINQSINQESRSKTGLLVTVAISLQERETVRNHRILKVLVLWAITQPWLR